jgi:hypothetical protein
MAYAGWPPDAFETTGEARTFEGRSFCPTCGSRLCGLSHDHVEIKIGTLDEAPTDLGPSEEIRGQATRALAAGAERDRPASGRPAARRLA